MTRTFRQIVLSLLLLLAAQVLCNKILLFNVATPMVFVYVLLRLPITWSTNMSLTIGFFCGLIVDIFNNTPGMHALASTLLADWRI